MKKRFIELQAASGNHNIDITELKYSEIADKVYDIVQKHDPFAGTLIEEIGGEKISMAVIDLSLFKNPFCHKQ